MTEQNFIFCSSDVNAIPTTGKRHSAYCGDDVETFADNLSGSTVSISDSEDDHHIETFGLPLEWWD